LLEGIFTTQNILIGGALIALVYLGGKWVSKP
jgi:hypothetical protein